MASRYLGKYELLESIGSGGQGEVYLARDSDLDRLVAIKLGHQHLGEIVHDVMQREAQISARFKHPNIGQIYDYGSDEELGPYLVLEYFHDSLTQLTEINPVLHWGQAARIALDIALGLSHLHEGGYVHGDIKPGNIMLRADGQAVILDLGISKNLNDQQDQEDVMGAAMYMAPERWMGEWDFSSDQYGLGVSLYEMLTGQLPFEGDTMAQVFEGHRTESFPELDPELYVPANLIEVVQRSTQKKPQDRYPSMKDMADALMQVTQPIEDSALMQSVRPLQPQIRGFRLYRHLAKGGFGDVYLASQMGESDTVLRTVVLKIMHSRRSGSNVAEENSSLKISYEKELVAMRFSHANLITYFDTGVLETPNIFDELCERIECGSDHPIDSFESHDFTECQKHDSGEISLVWVAMEYGNGGSLQSECDSRFRASKEFSIEEVIGIAIQIVEGVSDLHDNSVIHRDLKPGNVIRFEQGIHGDRPTSVVHKVSDFGLTSIMSETGFAGSRSEYGGGGSYGWSAPEQLLGHPVQETADIYAIGQVIYYLMTGSRAFDTPGVHPPSPSYLDPRIPNTLSDVVLKCLEFAPANRFSKTSQLHEELLKLRNLNEDKYKASEESISEKSLDPPGSIKSSFQMRNLEEPSEEERLWLLMAQTRMREEDFVDAVTYFNRYLEARPEDPEVFHARGVAYSRLGEHLSAIEDYTEAIRLDPEYTDAFYSRGSVYATLQDSQNAQKDFSKGIRLRYGDDYADSLIKDRDTGAPPPIV